METRAGSGLNHMVIVMTIIAAHSMRLSIVVPLVPLVADRYGASALMVGLIVSLFAFLPLFLAIPSGGWVDRFGPRRVLVVAGIFGLAFTILLVYSYAGGFALLIGAQVIGGMSHLLTVLSLQSHLSLLAAGRQREKNFGLYSFSGALGRLVGPLAAGVVTELWGFQMAFMLATVVGIVPATTALAIIPNTNGAKRVEPSETPLEAPPQNTGTKGQNHSLPDFYRNAFKLMKQPDIVGAMAISLIVLVVMQLRSSFYPIFMESAMGLSTSRIGVLLSTAALFGMLIQPFLDRIIARWGRRRVLAFALTCAGLGIGLVPLAPGFWGLLILAAAAGTGTGLSQPITMIMVADSTSDDERGLAMGLRLTANRVALFVGPLLSGVLVRLVGMPATFMFGGAILLGTIALAALTSRHRRQRRFSRRSRGNLDIFHGK